MYSGLVGCLCRASAALLTGYRGGTMYRPGRFRFAGIDAVARGAAVPPSALPPNGPKHCDKRQDTNVQCST